MRGWAAVIALLVWIFVTGLLVGYVKGLEDAAPVEAPAAPMAPGPPTCWN